jgi:hypothetical protein
MRLGDGENYSKDEDWDEANRRKRVKTLAILGFILLLILFSPALKGWLGSLFRSKFVRLENTQLVIPKGWLVSQEPKKIAAERPCWTIFCGLPSSASFVIEVSGLPDEAWERAARRVIAQRSSGDLTVETFNGDSGPFTCVHAVPVTEYSLTTCLDSRLGLRSTFIGTPSMRPIYLETLQSAHAMR